MKITKVTPGPGDAVRVQLDPPVMVIITVTEIVLFDGGDAGRVLWRKPEPEVELEVNEAGYPTGNYRKVT